MSDNRRIDSPFPHHWRQSLNKNLPLESIPETKTQHVYINSSNGYLDKRTERLSVELRFLERKVTNLTALVVFMANKLNISEEEIKKYL